MTPFKKHVFFAGLASATLPFAATDLSAADIACGSSYTVAAGDTLIKISKRAYGDDSFDALYDANTDRIGANPNRIYVGQALLIPCRDGAAVARAVAPVEPVVVDTEADDEIVATVSSGPLVLTFNKTSAPKFIINSGIIDLYLAQINEVTEGRVSFVDPDEVNRDPAAQLELVTSGAVDGAYVLNAHLADSHPLLQLPQLPLMGGSAEQTAVSLWRLHEEYLADTNYFDEAHLLGFISAPAAHIWRLSDEPVVLGEDIASQNSYAVPYFEGLDTRGPAAVRQEVAQRLDAFSEDENGTLTFFMAHGAARAAGIWTPDRAVTEVDNGLYTPTFSVILSNEAWSQISVEDRAAITEISGEYLAHRSASWDAFDNGHRQHMIDTGLNAVKASPALLKELETALAVRMTPWLQAAAAAGVPSAEAFNAYRSHLVSLQDRLIYRDTLSQ